MSIRLGTPVVCNELIGRGAYVAALDRLAEAVGSGNGQTVVLAGEAGIGKSRLVRGLAGKISLLGWRTLLGRCVEGDHRLPYAPLIDLLRSSIGEEPTRSDFAAVDSLVVDEICRLVPEFALAAEQRLRLAPLDPEGEKRRHFAAFSQLLAELAGKKPLLVIVEDAHWADDTSLDLLAYLARRIGPKRILLLLTYRSDEAGPSLTHFLAGLDRERLATELTLTRLTPGNVALMLQAIFGRAQPVPDGFLHTIYALTEGNPFFVEEVLGAMTASGQLPSDGTLPRRLPGQTSIPRSVHDAVRRRVGSLSQSTRHTLNLAAVAGRRFDFTLLAALAGVDEARLLEQVHELIGAQLVVEEAPDVFAFRHALTQQAITSWLLSRERRALHLAVAEALERVAPASSDRYLGDLAEHFYQAGAWERALEYAQRLGERARTLSTPRAAIDAFSRALEAARQLGRTPPARLYRLRGLAYETLGELDLARADLEQALDIARSTADPFAEWQALLDLGSFWAARDYRATGTYLRATLDLARARGDAGQIARSLNRLGNWYLNDRADPVEASRHYAEALAIEQSQGDSDGIAETLDLLAMASAVAGDGIAAGDYYRRAIEQFRAVDNPMGLCSTLACAAAVAGTVETETLVLPSLPRELGVERVEESLRLARSLVWRPGEAFALGMLSMVHGWYGEYGKAISLASSGLAIAEEIEHAQWAAHNLFALGAAYLDLLAAPTAQRYLERARALAEEIGSRLWLGEVSALLATSLLSQRQFSAAAAVLETVLGKADRMPGALVGGSLPVRMCWLTRADLVCQQGEPELALRIADTLIDTAPNLADRARPPLPRIVNLRGEALTQLGRLDEAETALGWAIEDASARGLRPIGWRSQLALGQLYRVQRRTEAAEQAWAAARSLVSSLAQEIPDPGERTGFLEAAGALIPSGRRPTPRRAAKAAFGGLTQREREVAALIAEGKTNREIASALVVGEVTVASHVTNILAKLGFGSRVQIAAWAAEKSLLTSPSESPQV